jgi:hypothetical protein
MQIALESGDLPQDFIIRFFDGKKLALWKTLFVYCLCFFIEGLNNKSFFYA